MTYLHHHSRHPNQNQTLKNEKQSLNLLLAESTWLFFKDSIIFLIFLSNFIPHEVIVCDDNDPPWLNGKIKSFINEKLRTYNAYCKNI